MKSVTLPAAKFIESEDGNHKGLHAAIWLCDEMDAPPPKADEDLSHSRHLPRMGKNSPLSVLCVSVVNQVLRLQLYKKGLDSKNDSRSTEQHKESHSG